MEGTVTVQDAEVLPDKVRAKFTENVSESLETPDVLPGRRQRKERILEFQKDLWIS